MIIGTAGHIDHGKTTLVRALTGVDTDRLPEEKRRGITIELGFAPLALDGFGGVGLVDVPGHEGFVRTMLAGATGVDVGLLVVAADEGVMPQTREHLAILTLLDVRALVVALTKCDAAEDEWLALVRDDVADLLAATRFAGAPMVETSAVSGAGVEELRRTLRDTLAALPARDATDLFRLPVDRAFTVNGTGTVVTGTVWTGTGRPDTPMRLFPANRLVRPRGFQSHGAQVGVIPPGSRAAVALAGVELSEVTRGALLVEESAWGASRVLRGDVALLAGIDRPIRAREWVRLHLGTTEVGARIVAQGGALAPGEHRGVRIVLDGELVARAGDRFVLRLASPAATIGGGVVTDPLPPGRRARPWPAGLSVEGRLQRLVAESGSEGLAERSLPVRLGVRPSEVAALIAGAALFRLEGRLYLPETITGLIAAVAQRLDDFHRDFPLESRAPMAHLRAGWKAPSALIDAAVAALVREGKVESGSGGVRRAGWEPVIDDASRARLAALRDRLEGAGAEPPSVAELRSEAGDNDPVPFLRILERDGVVVQVEADRFFSAGAVEALLEKLRGGMTTGRVYSPSELRELLGVSRKYLIPFLEYCDRRRITERREQGRVKA